MSKVIKNEKLLLQQLKHKTLGTNYQSNAPHPSMSLSALFIVKPLINNLDMAGYQISKCSSIVIRKQL